MTAFCLTAPTCFEIASSSVVQKGCRDSWSKSIVLRTGYVFSFFFFFWVRCWASIQLECFKQFESFFFPFLSLLIHLSTCVSVLVFCFSFFFFVNRLSFFLSPVLLFPTLSFWYAPIWLPFVVLYCSLRPCAPLLYTTACTSFFFLSSPLPLFHTTAI